MTHDKIIATVAYATGFTVSQLKGKCRISKLVFARWTAMYFCHRLLKLSSTGIGNLFNRDHGAVLYALKQIPYMPAVDLENMEIIRNQLGDGGPSPEFSELLGRVVLVRNGTPHLHEARVLQLSKSGEYVKLDMQGKTAGIGWYPKDKYTVVDIVDNPVTGVNK